MAEVPRIVHERLRSQVTAGEHPDANLLSAFAERALTQQEQEQVLDHLSRCAECREVVALLALPQVEEERLVAAAAAARASAAASRSWWRSPVVHWSALTAAALVVLIAVGTRMRLRQQYSASAPAIAKYEPAEKQIASAPATAPAPPEQKEPQKLAETTKAPRRAQAFNGPKPMGAVSGGNLASGDRVATGSAGVGGHNLPPPAALPMKPHANADAAAPTTDGPAFESANEQTQAKAAPAPSAAAKASGGVSAAAVPALRTEGAALSQGRSANFTKRAFLGPRWSVSDSGALQRSFDGGRSWKDVAVAEGVSFRAVAVVVNDVWAGGSGGALFHSTDGGEHWARVRVQANDRTPSGDFVRIEFADAQNGVVASSTGETWRTSDAGLTWRWQ
ncbi:MAG: YCF48-related protein [Terriglobales bacterium]